MTVLRDPSTWPERTFYAMGCQMSAHLAVETEQAPAALAQVEAFFHAAEGVLSRFRPDSELAYLNAHPGKWLSLSPLLWDVVATALEMAEQTNGLFDPTLLFALEAAGYNRSFDRMTTGADATPSTQDTVPHQGTPRRGGGYRQVRLRRAGQSLNLPAGLKLDLGGIAKGYVAQAAVNHLRAWGPALVDAGGDLVAGDAPPGHPGWPVAVAAPASRSQENAADIARLWLANAALATSGIDYRQWQAHGRTMHHIINPATGEPAVTDLLSATVLAPTAAQAESWAKAAIILGAARAERQLGRRGFAALLVLRDGSILTTSPAQRWLTGPSVVERQERTVQ